VLLGSYTVATVLFTVAVCSIRTLLLEVFDGSPQAGANTCGDLQFPDQLSFRELFVVGNIGGPIISREANSSTG
jgi:hypothetical protein